MNDDQMASEAASQPPPKADTPLSAEAIFVGLSGTIGAATLVGQYTAAAILAALAEKSAIDPARVFELLETLADGFEHGAAGAGSSGRLTATMLRAVRPTFENLMTIPPGAGRA